MREFNKVTALMVVMVFILSLGLDLYTPSFPAMEKAFSTSEQMIQLTLTTYLIGYVVGLMFLGPVSDAFGRKRPLILSLVCYALLSALISTTKSVETLLFYRFLQGASATVIGISFRTILADVFSGKDLFKAMSIVLLSYSVSTISAPLMGGYLQAYFGWKANFFFLSGYALFLLYLIGFHLPETHLDRTKIQLSLLWGRYKEVLANKSFLGASICIGFQTGFILLFNLFAPFFLSKVLGYSSIEYGHIALFTGVVAFLGISCNRLFLHKYSYLSLIPVGVYGIAAISLVYVALTWLYPVNLWSFLIPIFLILFMQGFLSANMMSHAIGLFPKGKGTASALQPLITICLSILLTIGGSYLATTSALPLATFYFGIAICTILGYLLLFKNREKKKADR